MTTRRKFFGQSAAGLLLASSANGARPSYSFDEIEAKIRRGDLKGVTKQDLGTPAMILDLDLFEKNIRTMADHSKKTGLDVRPHVKIHKCPVVSKKQIALGAIGVSCATIAECEYMHESGVSNILWTCQPAGANKIGRVAALAKRDPTFLAVADDPRTVKLLDEAAGAAGVKLNTIVDVTVGLTRQGCQPGETALKIGRQIEKARNLQLRGVMGYSGAASHTHGWETRKKTSHDAMAALVETRALFLKSGLPVEIMTGGSTGTYNIDTGVEGMTELQAGSYVFMDTLYMRVGGKSDEHTYTDFGAALTVLTTVISKTRPNEAAIDAGNKAMLRTTDEVKGRPEVVIENQGAEYGLLRWKETERDIELGELVEIYPSNLDTSTNVYDRYYVAKGDNIVDVWPIMGRSGVAQR